MAALVALFYAWSTLALGVKRCHDFERSGWLYFWIAWLPGMIASTFSVQYGAVSFVIAIPFIGNIAGAISFLGHLYVLFKRGTDGPNKFGYPP